MNKNDCENLSYILAQLTLSETVLDEFFKLDVRIKDLYDGWTYSFGRSNLVDTKFEELMINKYGHGWALKKDSKHDNKQFLEDARQFVYGEEYDYIFKK